MITDTCMVDEGHGIAKVGMAKKFSCALCARLSQQTLKILRTPLLPATDSKQIIEFCVLAFLTCGDARSCGLRLLIHQYCHSKVGLNQLSYVIKIENVKKK